MLELYARRNPPTDLKQLGGSCEAFYDGKEWPCQIGSRHVHVHWFAYLNQPLGLNKSQLDALRRQYWIENLPEATFFRSFMVLSLTTIFVVMVTFIRWRWSKARSKAMVVSWIDCFKLSG